MLSSRSVMPLLACLTVAVTVSCVAPAAAPTAWTRTEPVFGDIPATLTVYGTEDEALFEGFVQVSKNIDKEMSMWDRPYTTDIMRLAEASGKHPVEVSEDTINVLRRALEIGDLTDGALDVAIGPLVKLWGVATDHPKVPLQKEIQALLPLVQRRDLVLEGNSAFLKRPGMIIDVGGIAKGYAADKSVEFLRSKGVTAAIVDLGGNVYAMGSKPDGKGGLKPWKIGIQNPMGAIRGTAIGYVNATNLSLVTSGVYERRFQDPASGKWYHHILDPKTGWPSDNGLVSVTVVSPSSIDCDGFAKVIVLGLKRGWQVLQSQGLEGIFVTEDKKVYVTPKLAKDFTLTDTEYQLRDQP